MHVSTEQMNAWCRRLLRCDGDSGDALSDYLRTIPRLDSLADLPSGTSVLVRGDVDAKPGEKIGQGDIRLRSMVDTLQYGRDRGWKQIIFGHIGRKPEGTLAAVAQRLGQLLDCDVPLIRDWLDEPSMSIADQVPDAIERAAPGSVLMLDNTRRYDIERALWNADCDDLDRLCEPLAQLANEFATKVATTYINEALSAGSLDASSTAVPAAMDRVCLGSYVGGEFSGPMMRCLETELVVFSGLKIDKLDDLEAMIRRGTIRRVFAAGSLAMALTKAVAQLDGGDYALGVAEDPAHADKPYFIPTERIAQARRMVSEGRAGGIEFVVPCDFVTLDGAVVEELAADQQQLDVGPQTCDLFERKVGEFLSGASAGTVAFYNGVFGMFEDRRFEEGTRRFVQQLKRMTDADIEVYVGGGEGGKALEKYGQPDWVTHTFTAGGTVLNALGSEPVPYLVALRAAASR